MNTDIFEAETKETAEEAERKSTLETLMEVRKEKDSSKKGARLTLQQWREIELLWESGEVTLKDLSNRYGKHVDTFTTHFKKFGVKRGSRAEELKRVAAEMAREKARDDASVVSERIRNTKEQHYKMAEAIGKLVFNEILEARQKGGNYKSIQGDLRSLFIAMDTLKKVREERWIVLGLDKEVIDEDSLPELVMSTMTPEQIQALRQAQEEDDELMGIDDDQLNIQ